MGDKGKITLNRLSTKTIKNENVSNDKPDAINFRVNHSIYIVGIGAFGGKGKNSIKMGLFEADNAEHKLGFTEIEWHKEYDDEYLKKICFKNPIQLKAGIVYTILTQQTQSQKIAFGQNGKSQYIINNV